MQGFCQGKLQILLHSLSGVAQPSGQASQDKTQNSPEVRWVDIFARG